nr:hypothetical protein [Endozoicomonas sp.]
MSSHFILARFAWLKHLLFNAFDRINIEKRCLAAMALFNGVVLNVIGGIDSFKTP